MEGKERKVSNKSFLVLNIKKTDPEMIQFTLESGETINIWVKEHGSGNKNFSKVVIEASKKIIIKRLKSENQKY